MEKIRDMRKHVTFVGVLHIVFGALGVIGALTVFFVFDFAQSFVQGEEIAEAVLSAIKLLLPIMIMLVSALSIIGGIALFGYHEWARILIIIMSAVNCLNVPIGTAKGVYSIWALLQDDTISLFRGEAPPNPEGEVTTRTN